MNLGHEEISPKRKIDPGPAFPLDDMRNHLFAKEEKHQIGKVSASSLNIRKGAGVEFEKLAEALPTHHEVEVIESKGAWVKVKTTVVIEGWVSKKYLEK